MRILRLLRRPSTRNRHHHQLDFVSFDVLANARKRKSAMGGCVVCDVPREGGCDLVELRYV